MAQTTVSIKIDEELKKDFAQLCDDLGLTVSSACLVFIKKAVSEQKIPFELSVEKKNISSDYER